MPSKRKVPPQPQAGIVEDVTDDPTAIVGSSHEVHPTRQSSLLAQSGARPGKSTDETAARIMKHMNADHPESLYRYVQFFGRVWAISARGPRMIRLDRDTMTIATSGPLALGSSDAAGLHTTISFEPRLAPNLSDARQRLIDMDREALHGLGRKPETVRRYLGPQSAFEKAWWCFVAFAWVLLASKRNFEEGSLAMRTLFGWAPFGLRELLRAWQPRIFFIMAGLHALEAGEMAIGKMRSFNVEMGSRVWWAWVLSTAFEGFPVWGRLDVVVAEDKKRREAAAH